MRIGFRADASISIGSGHVMRCLTLADALAREGDQAFFVMRDLPGHLLDLIQRHGHACTLLPAPSGGAQNEGPPPHAPWLGVPWQVDAKETAAALQKKGSFDWLVVDLYAVDARWERTLQQPGLQILAIDDLADRPHDCDVLLDQNLQEAPDRYARLVPETTRLCLGPEHALLRPQFAAARRKLKPRDGSVRRVLVFFGGSDPDNLTERALAALSTLDRSELVIDVVVGASNPRRERIAELCASQRGVNFHFNLPDLAALTAVADLAIGAAGVTTWERACLGLPALVVTLATNQRPVATCSEASGILRWLGDGHEVSVERLADAVAAALADPAALSEQSRRGMALVDGRGTERVVAAMRAGYVPCD